MARLPQLRRRHRGFPDLALLDLPVAEHAIDAGRRAAQLEPERQAERDREALAQRAGGGLDARQRGPVGMALERRAELAQRDELFLGKVAGLGQHGIERRDGVALGEHDPIALGPVRPLGIVPQAAEVERGEDVDHRERAARMPGARVREHAQDLNAAFARDRFETRLGHQSRSSMKPAISSTWTEGTAISGAYTTSSAAHTIVPFTSFVMPEILLRNVAMLSLMRSAFALIGAAIRPSRMI